MKYYLDKRSVRKDKTSPLKLVIRKDGKVSMMSVGVSFNPADWDDVAGRVRSGARNSVLLNTRLRDILDKAEDYILQLKISGQYLEMDAEQLKKNISLRVLSSKARERTPATFIARLEKYRDRQSRKGTWHIYNQTGVALRSFDPQLDKRTFKDIDVDYLTRFDRWCTERGLKTNSIAIHMRNIRTVVNDAIDDGITTLYPFRKFKIRHEETRKRSLSPDQLRDIFTRPMEDWQQEYVDMFRLMIYLIGINAADLFQAKPSSIDNGRLVYHRQKTGRLYSVKVEPEAMEIIRKYRGKKWLLSPLDRYDNYKDYLHHLNGGLKAIGRVTGKQNKVIEDGPYKELSSYWARHTWASLAYSLGIGVDIIGQALGHSDRSHSVTMIYIRPDQSKVDDANRKVIDFLNKTIFGDPTLSPDTD